MPTLTSSAIFGLASVGVHRRSALTWRACTVGTSADRNATRAAVIADLDAAADRPRVGRGVTTRRRENATPRAFRAGIVRSRAAARGDRLAGVGVRVGSFAGRPYPDGSRRCYVRRGTSSPRWFSPSHTRGAAASAAPRRSRPLPTRKHLRTPGSSRFSLVPGRPLARRWRMAAAIRAAAARHGARTLCDATQAVGWLPIGCRPITTPVICHAYKMASSRRTRARGRS
jgi:hypothetical protein